MFILRESNKQRVLEGGQRFPGVSEIIYVYRSYLLQRGNRPENRKEKKNWRKSQNGEEELPRPPGCSSTHQCLLGK
jgi:hypothetical protein